MSLDRVILVEDNVAVLRHLENSIEWVANGLEVAGAYTNGRDAIDAIDASIALVVTDIVMPRCTGVEVVEAIASGGLDIESIVISAYDEFDYVHDAMRAGAREYLLKPVDELDLLAKARDAVAARANRIESRRRVSELVPRLADEIVHGIVTGSARGRPVESDASFAGLEIQRRYGQCIVFELQAHSRFLESRMRQEYHARVLLARASIERILAGLDAHVVTVTDRRIVALIQCSREQLSSISRRVEELVELAVRTVRKATGFETAAAAGDPRYSWQLYHESYLDGVRRLESTFSGEGAVGASLTYPVAIESRLLVAARDRDDESALREIDELCDSMQRDGLPAEASRTLAAAILARVQLDVTQTVEEFERLAGQTRRSLEQCLTPEQLRESSRRVILAEIDRRAEIARDSIDSFAKRVASIVRDRHADPSLSVESIAADVFLSANYVSRQFKLATGQNLRDYLVQCRIEEAMKLLRYSPLRVYEVAQKVGFRSQQYFATRFRELVGMTPGEYARSTDTLSPSTG